jgi:DNA-binding NarL/FixJ family response regulator
LSQSVYQRRARGKYSPSDLAYLSRPFRVKMNAAKSFQSLTARVDWLNNKIEQRVLADLPFDLYVEERDAILWMMDKVKELSERLQMVRGLVEEEEIDRRRSLLMPVNQRNEALRSEVLRLLDEGMKQADIARALNRSRERIRQIIRDAPTI